MTEAGSGTYGYRPELDGIRTLAILGVLFFHAALSLPFRIWGGLLGVDLFFVLSGALITSLLVQEYGVRGSIDLSNFYLRRVLRLVPAFIVLLVACAALAPALDDQTRSEYALDALIAFSAVGNWFQGAGRVIDVLTHTWSLAIEWQFYLLWPALLLAGLRRGISSMRLAQLAAGGAVAVAVLRSLVHHHVGDVAAFHWTVTRSDGVLLGSALALAIAADGRIAGILRNRALVIVGATAAGVLVANVDASTPFFYDGGLFLLVVAFAIVVGHVSVRRTGFVATILSTPPLPQLGRISYGIYLFHQPVFRLVLDRERRGLAWFAVATLTSIAVAVVSYVVVERPAVALRRRLHAGALRRRAVNASANDPIHRRPASRHEARTRG